MKYRQAVVQTFIKFFYQLSLQSAQMIIVCHSAMSAGVKKGHTFAGISFHALAGTILEVIFVSTATKSGYLKQRAAQKNPYNQLKLTTPWKTSTLWSEILHVTIPLRKTKRK